MTDRSDHVRDEQATAERVDADKIDPGDFPPERPLGVEEWGTTPREEEARESVRLRGERTDERDDLREPPEPVAGLLHPEDDGEADVTGEAVALEGDEPDVLSAEEAAMHLVEPADEGQVLGIDAEGIERHT